MDVSHTCVDQVPENVAPAADATQQQVDQVHLFANSTLVEFAIVVRVFAFIWQVLVCAWTGPDATTIGNGFPGRQCQEQWPSEIT